MLKPIEMQKVRIIALRSAITTLIEELHKAGVMEITKKKFNGLDEGRPLEFFNVVSEQLVKVRAISAALEKYSEKKGSKQPKLIEIKETLAQSRELGLEEQLKTLTANVSSKEAEVSKLKEKLGTIGKLLPFKGIDFSALQSKTISYRVGEYPSEKLNFLKEMLDKEFDQYNLVSPDDSPTTLIIFKKTDKNVDAILGNSGFSLIEVPEETTIPITTKRLLEESFKQAESELESSNKKLVELADKHLDKINDIIYSLKVEADRAEVASRFGHSKSMVIFEGWLIKKDMPEVEKLIATYKKQAMLESVPFSHEEVPPTVLGNPKVGSPFEFLTASYSLPNYFELDPSMIYFITLPILYGMIVGDFIYGVLSIFIAMFLLKKFKNSYVMTNVSRIWMYSAFATMIFGIIFDEWGGASHSFWLGPDGYGLLAGPLYTGFHRLHEVAMLIALTAIVGILHLTLGFIIGAYNHWNHDRKHSYAKIAWIGVLYGGTLAISAIMFGVFPQVVGFAGIGLLVLSAIGLAITEGIIGILEIPGLLGNVLSYTRIAAVGIVGVVIAELVNDAFAPLPSKGILLAVLFFPLFVLLHFANCFVAMFEALIQGGRLNIVEFRSKFLEGGGRAFMPFSMHLKNK
jgi:V/A-type H+-transporting ATPase subunit I